MNLLEKFYKKEKKLPLHKKLIQKTDWIITTIIIGSALSSIFLTKKMKKENRKKGKLIEDEVNYLLGNKKDN